MEPQISLTIDGREVEASQGATILEAARVNHVHIPTLCHHPALSAWGGCRLCLVEVDEAPRLAASCVMPVRPGMRVVTHNPRILEARRTVLQCLFSEGEHQCMICAQSGDCELQELAYQHGLDHLTLPPLERRRPIDLSHPHLAIDHGRCVLCGRCVRACRELAGAGVLDYHFRGSRTMIGADLGTPLGQSSCISCGACEQLCPTGAISLRQRTHYAVSGKKRDWEAIDSCCPTCGLLCPTRNLVREGVLLRVESPLESGEGLLNALCSRGRFAPLESPPERPRRPLIREEGGAWREGAWPEAYALAAARLAEVRASRGAEALRGVISSDASWEEMQAFQRFVAEYLDGAHVDCSDGAAFRLLAAAGRAAGVDLAESAPTAAAQADCLLVAGGGLAESHPVLASFVRRALYGQRARLVAVGSSDGLAGDRRGLHLAAAGEALAVNLEELLRLLGGSAPSGQPGTPLARAAQFLANARRPFILAGGEIWRQASPRALEAILRLAARSRPPRENRLPLSLLKPAGNSAASWRLGLGSQPAAAPPAGYGAGVRVLAGPGDLAGPWAPAWGELEFTVVFTPCFSAELAALPAGVILPTPAWLEADGAYLRVDQAGPRPKPRVLAPPPGVPATADLLAELGSRLAGR